MSNSTSSCHRALLIQYTTMISRSVILACFLAGSSAAFAVQQPSPPTFSVRSSVLESSNVLRMSGGEAELSVSFDGRKENP